MWGCGGSRQAQQGSGETEERDMEEASEHSLRESRNHGGFGEPKGGKVLVGQGSPKVARAGLAQPRA